MTYTNESSIAVRVVAAGRSLETIYVQPGTSLGDIVANYRDDQGRNLTSEGQMEYFVNGASVDKSYVFTDENQMLIVVGAVFNG